MLSPIVLYLPCSVRYTFPDCEAHVRSVSNEPTSGCEARVQKSWHKGTLLDGVVQRCCEKREGGGLYRDGAARKVLGDRDFVFGDELTRDNLLKIAVTSDELREVNVCCCCWPLKNVCRSG